MGTTMEATGSWPGYDGKWEPHTWFLFEDEEGNQHMVSVPDSVEKSERLALAHQKVSKNLPRR